MEAIDTKAIKDAVAKKYGFDDWDSLLLSDHHIDSYINEVISEVAKQVAEATKQSCAENAVVYFDESGFMDCYIKPSHVSVDKRSILTAPSPEII